MLKPVLTLAAAGVIGLILWTVLGNIVGPVLGILMGILFLLIKIALVVGLVWLVMRLLRKRPDDEKGEAHAE
jgi:hypothetical protein